MGTNLSTTQPARSAAPGYFVPSQPEAPSAGAPLALGSNERCDVGRAAPTWARVVPDARPCNSWRSKRSEGAIGVGIAHPRLGTSRGHAGCRPVDDPTSPKRSAGISPVENAATGVGRTTVKAAQRGPASSPTRGRATLGSRDAAQHRCRPVSAQPTIRLASPHLPPKTVSVNGRRARGPRSRSASPASAVEGSPG